MKFASYIPNGDLYSPSETSRLSSQLERDAIAHYHKHIRTAANRASKLTKAASNSLQKVPGLESWSSDNTMHPFKIYQMPNRFRPKAFRAPFFWRTFRIRNGFVLTTNANGITPTGTDLIDQPYDYVFVTAKNGTRLSNDWNVAPPNAIDIEVPDNKSKFWFWVEVSTDGLSAVIRYGDDPTVSTYSDGRNVTWNSTNPWSGFPTIDGNHIPLGYVDTLTGHAQSIAFVRQYWRTDIMGAGGGSSPCNLYG